METYRPIAQMMPDAWPIFFHHRKLLSIQQASIPEIIKGKDVLISSPTASGKTEAVVAPLFQRHTSFKRNRVSVVYVAPTKALVNDIYYRMVDYFGGCRDLGGIYRYTGDHHDFRNNEHGFMVVVTPEAFDSLQLTKDKMLSSIRAVVIDELHFLHGTPRGQQLRHVMDRLKSSLELDRFCKDRFQIIATSATVHSPEEVKRLWFDGEVVHITDKSQRTLEGIFLKVPETGEDRDRSFLTAEIEKIIAMKNFSKTLLFANSRNEAHEVAARLAQRMNPKLFPVFLHFGILAASERDRIESEMRTQKRGICVATSTLEIGIDIGDIDCIILLYPPKSVSSFLQRVGRGNRRTGVCRFVAIYRNKEEKAIYDALIDLARSGELEETHDYDRPSVRFQQVVSLVWRSLKRSKSLTKEQLGIFGHSAVAEDMLATGNLKEVDGTLLLGDDLMDEGNRRSIHTNISGPSTVDVIDDKTGETVAKVSDLLEKGSIYLGGILRKVEKIGPEGIFLGEDRHVKQKKLARLPSIRYKYGFSRMLIWQLTAAAGIDPKNWTRQGAVMLTWGGLVNNRLLTLLYKLHGICEHLKCDDFGISDIPTGLVISSDRSLHLARNADWEKLALRDINFFRQQSRYFEKLSLKMKHQEAFRSLPVKTFTAWLENCNVQQINRFE